MNAPMGLSASLELAAAVSNSGGLGLIAMAPRLPADIPTVLNQMRALTSKPFGINFVPPLDSPERLHEKLQACLEWGVKIVTFWGKADEYVEQAHRAGALVTYTVGSVSEAHDAAAAGADVIVAQGWEAGGHVRGTITTLALVPAVVDAVSPIPVVAAGGIADGRGVAAALALGASGVWIGTRFLASTEAFTTHGSSKESWRPTRKTRCIPLCSTVVFRTRRIVLCGTARLRCGNRPVVRRVDNARWRAKSSRIEQMEPQFPATGYSTR